MIERFATLQVTEYNGFVFPATVETVGYKITPKYDTARRTVIYSLFDIVLHWYMDDTDTTTPAVADMVARLQRPAGILEYTLRGFGVGELVNRGKVWDVDWGPRPGPLDLKPKGNENCVECTWAVQFAIPTCDDAIYKNAVREFCFAVDYVRSRAGLTTRTYKAHVSIAVTRPTVDSRVIPDTADRLLEAITPPALLGYRRESQNSSLSEDKSTLTLTVVDIQLPALAPPPGCVDAKVEHSYSTQAGNFAKWAGTITGTYEVAKSATTGVDTVRTVEDFLGRVDQRLAIVATMVLGKGLPGAAFLGAGLTIGRNAIIPIAFSVSEPDVYGSRQIRLSMSYSVSGMGLSEILEKGGLWRPWGTQYNFWQQQTPTIHHPRGEAKLVFSPGDDRIVDLCGPGDPKKPGTGPAGSGGGFGFDPTGRTPNGPSAGFGNLISKVFPGPDPTSSWIEYRSNVTVHPDTGRVVGHTLPTAPLATDHRASGWDAMKGVTPALPGPSAFPPLQEQTRPNQTGGGPFVHQRTKPTLRFTLFGHAVRVGYPIPCPELVSVNGERVILVGKPAFTTGIVGNAITPVYGARWRLEYVATGDRAAAGPPPTPPNPYLA